MNDQPHSQAQRRAQNESVFKERNDNVDRLASDVLDKGSKADMLIEFTCECSNENCTEVIGMPLREYERVRQNDRQFLVKPGHQQTDIEKVVEYSGYLVVEKHFDPPPSDGKLNST